MLPDPTLTKQQVPDRLDRKGQHVHNTMRTAGVCGCGLGAESRLLIRAPPITSR